MIQLHNLPFSSGRPRRDIGTSRDLDLWVEAEIAETVDEREMKAAQAEQIAARKGEVVPDRYTSAPLEAASGSSPDEGVPSATQQGSAPASATSLIGVAAQAAGPQRAPIDEAVTTGLSLKPNANYEEPFRTLTARASARPLTAPITEAIKEAVPPKTRKYGDEVSVPFLSETGSPIQQRVFSPTKIRTADEQAAAVAAAIERRRAERVAKNQAELDALRVPNPEEFLRRAAATRKTERAQPMAPPARSTVDPISAAPIRQNIIPTSVPPVATVSTNLKDAPASQAGAPSTPSSGPASTARSAPEPKGDGTGISIDRPAASARSADHDRSDQVDRRRSDPAAETPHPSPAADSTEKVEEPDAPQAAPAAADPSQPDPKAGKRVRTAEEVRRRALLAAKSRGRGR